MPKISTRKAIRCALCQKKISENKPVYVDETIMVPFCSIEHARVTMFPTLETVDKFIDKTYVTRETEVHCTLCYKVMTGDTSVYVVDNDPDSIFCSMTCIKKLNSSLNNRYIRKLTAEESLRSDSYINTGDIVIVDDCRFLIAENINDYIVINLSTGKVDTNGYEDMIEIQSDFDKRYGEHGYLIIKNIKCID